jgi:hypothetical protein
MRYGAKGKQMKQITQYQYDAAMRNAAGLEVDGAKCSLCRDEYGDNEGQICRHGKAGA